MMLNLDPGGKVDSADTVGHLWPELPLTKRNEGEWLRDFRGEGAQE